MMEAVSAENEEVAEHMLDLVNFELENREDDFCFMNAMRVLTNICRHNKELM